MYILLTFRDVAVKSVLDQSKYIDVIKEINISKISKKRDHIRKGLPQYSCCDWVWSYNLYLYVIYWYDPHLTGFWYGVITVTTISRFWVPDCENNFLGLEIVKLLTLSYHLQMRFLSATFEIWNRSFENYYPSTCFIVCAWNSQLNSKFCPKISMFRGDIYTHVVTQKVSLTF